MLYIGIDVHKKLCHACIKDRDGNVLEELTFPNKSYGVDMLLETIGNRKAKAVIESTGNLWLRLYLCLEEAGIEVILANPKKTKAIAEARLKNDKVDASTLADLLRADLVAPCYIPPRVIREFRSLIRHRMNLVSDMTRVKNRVHALLDKYELEGFSGTDQFGKAGTEWLRSITGELSKVDQQLLDASLRQIELLNQLIDEAELKIAEGSVESDDVKLLMTIPGVDYYTGMLFLSEIGDIERFARADKLISWLGLAPRVHQSGSRIYNGRITKEGSPRVRWALIQAARSAVRWDDHFTEKYHRIKNRRGDSKAIVAVAREIAVAMYHMLTRREVYRFSGEAFVSRKYKRLESTIRNVDRIMGRAPAAGFFPHKK
jgi:transposase